MPHPRRIPAVTLSLLGSSGSLCALCAISSVSAFYTLGSLGTFNTPSALSPHNRLSPPSAFRSTYLGTESPQSAGTDAYLWADTRLWADSRPSGSDRTLRDPAQSTAPSPSDSPQTTPHRLDEKGGDGNSRPKEEEEVAPGDDPASCDGCELAGLGWAGTLWGLFAVERRPRKIPRTVIKGYRRP